MGQGSRDTVVFKKIKKLLSGGQGTEEIRGEPPVEATLKPELVGPTSPLQRLLDCSEGLGHPGAPLNSKRYSPSSRVPCTDIVPFLADCFAIPRLGDACKALRMILKENPGVGTDASWIDERIHVLADAPFEHYVELRKRSNYCELRGAFTVAMLSGGQPEFLITDPAPALILDIVLPHQPNWTAAIDSLVERGNQRIEATAEELREDTSYWDEFERLSFDASAIRHLGESTCSAMSQLLPSERLLLLHAAEREAVSLNEVSNYAIRSFGIEEESAIMELRTNGFFLKVESASGIASAFSKAELLEFCEAHGIEVRKSWNKTKLSEAIYNESEDVRRAALRKANLARVDFSRFPDLRHITDVRSSHLDAMRGLCFMPELSRA